MDDGPEKAIVDQVVEAMTDPLRLRILGTVAEVAFEARAHPDEEWGMSVRQLSRRLGEPPRRVRYHLDVLSRQGLLEVVTTKKRRGVVERLFAPIHLPVLFEEETENLSPATQQKLFLGCLRMVLADASASLRTGVAVRRVDWAMMRLPAEVDEQGWKELAELHLDLYKEAQEIVARAATRIRTTKEKPIRAVSASMLFEAAPADSEPEAN